MRLNLRIFVLLTLVFIPSLPRSADGASPVITVSWEKGKAWFLNPSGKTFLSMGINHIGSQSTRDQASPSDGGNFYNPVQNQFKGNRDAWIQDVFARLGKWRFNTIGSWSDEDFYGKNLFYTYMTDVARGPNRAAVLENLFSREFEELVRRNAQRVLKFKEDPNHIGYFLDNEMPWWGEFGWRTDGQKSLLQKYAASAIEDANKEALISFLKERYKGEIDNLNQTWGTAFASFESFNAPVTLIPVTKRQKADANAWAGKAAERYFEVTTRAIREADPSHLILGVRFAGEAPWEVVEACGRYCDVVSVNHYQKTGNINKTLLDNFYVKGKKPLLITEYSFRAMENQSGDPNTKGADVTVPTQEDRVEHTNRFARQLLDLPYVLGLHWFEWADECPQGRFDGEDSNYGLVDIHDKEYALLTQKHAKINSSAEFLHRTAENILPEKFEDSAPDYRKAPAGTKVQPDRLFLKIDKSVSSFAWSDKGNGAKIASDASTGELVLDYESGSGWGCGISYSSNVPPFVKDNLVDLTGYNFFEFQAFVPKGVGFAVYTAESGANNPSFFGVDGSDGEAYGFPLLMGTGKWETYRVNLADLELRSNYGNPQGNHYLDLQSLLDMEFYIPGRQGAGKILVKDLVFKVK